jgi:hypothetical protein
MRCIKFQIPITLLTVVFICSCGNGTGKKTAKGQYPDLKNYFKSEASVLDSLDPAAHVTVVENDEPVDKKYDSMDWKKELSIFEILDLAAEGNRDKFLVSVDSNARLRITHYSAVDTAQEIQSVSITELDGKTDLVEAFLKKRSFVVDRDTRLSYQPGKGYGIQVRENYIWSKPGSKEIFVEIESGNFLRK